MARTQGLLGGGGGDYETGGAGPIGRAVSPDLGAHGDASKDGGGQGPEEAAPGSALPAYDQDLVGRGMTRAARRPHRDAGHGGMKGSPGLTGRVPLERGSLWSIRSRPLPLTRLASPVGRPDRTARRRRGAGPSDGAAPGGHWASGDRGGPGP